MYYAYCLAIRILLGINPRIWLVATEDRTEGETWDCPASYPRQTIKPLSLHHERYSHLLSRPFSNPYPSEFHLEALLVQRQSQLQ